MLVHVRFVGAAETAAPPELAFVHSVGEHALFARLVQFLLWQAAKPSGDSCPPLMDNLWVENKKMELNGIVVSIFFVSLPREYPNITN